MNKGEKGNHKFSTKAEANEIAHNGVKTKYQSKFSNRSFVLTATSLLSGWT